MARRMARAEKPQSNTLSVRRRATAASARSAFANQRAPSRGYSSASSSAIDTIKVSSPMLCSNIPTPNLYPKFQKLRVHEYPMMLRIWRSSHWPADCSDSLSEIGLHSYFSCQIPDSFHMARSLIQ